MFNSPESSIKPLYENLENEYNFLYTVKNAAEKQASLLCKKRFLKSFWPGSDKLDQNIDF